MIQAVIFDLDGTLLNTLQDLYLCTNQVLKYYHCPEKSMDEVRSYLGNGIKALLEKALPEQQKHLLDAVYDQFLPLYEKHKADHTKPYPHILSLLNTLKQKKMKMAIVSNKIDSAVKELCIPLFGEYLSVMLGETPTRLKKPNPDMVYEALKQLQVDKDQALFVGDSETDVLTAKNANMRVCGVSWGFRGKDVLKQLNVDFLIYVPMELLNIIEKENQK